MAATIVTFADLGAKKNLKTIDIAPVIDGLVEHAELQRVMCRMQRHAPSYVHQIVPTFLHYGLKLLEKIIPGFPGRNLEEELFDIRAARRMKPADVVFFHPSFFPRTVRAAKNMGAITVGMAVIVHPQTSLRLLQEEHDLLGLTTTEGLKRSRWSHDRADVAESFDYIIAVSEFIRQSYIEHGYPAERIFVAQNDITISSVPVVQKKDTIFRVLYVAHTNTLKGLHYLLDAWKMLHLANAELVIVGGYSTPVPGPLKDRYAAAIAADPTIVWAGFTKHPQSYYEQASVFVLPSITEGNPRVIMEAMNAGLPVITTTNAQSIVEDGVSGYIVPIRDVAALAEKINVLYDDEVLRKTMGTAGRTALQHKKSFAVEVVDIYQKLTERT